VRFRATGSGLVPLLYFEVLTTPINRMANQSWNPITTVDLHADETQFHIAQSQDDQSEKLKLVKCLSGT